MANECQCECGKIIADRLKFVHGHNRKGTNRSPETIAKMQATIQTGDCKAKISEAIKRTWTVERKEKHIALRVGKKHSLEHRKKIAIANKGKVRTTEMKEKLRQINLGKINGDNNPMRNPDTVLFFRGEKNPNWKGGTSRIYKNGYGSTEYKQWRRSVFERDNYTCQDCGKSGGKYVTAHHIKSFSKHPELRFELSNGITLCEECHCKVDNYRARFKKKIA